MSRPQDPLRVLLITGSLGPGGTEMAVMTLLRRLLLRPRVSAQLVVLGEGGDHARRLREEGVAVLELGLRGSLRRPRALAGLLRITRLVRRESIDVVHTFLFDADLYGMLFAWLGRPRAVITTRRAIKSHRPHHLRAYRWTHRFVDRIVANSEAVRRFTLEVERAPAAKLRVIPNGVDLERFAAGDGGRTRRRLGLGPEHRLIGAVGTLKPVKGQDLLLEAAAPLLSADACLRLILAGGQAEPFTSELRRRADELGVAGQTLLTGAVEDVADLLAALEIFVLPSRSEGMSNALLEAMAAGRPIVATAVGGNPENLEGGRVGRLVPADDVAALREAIAALLADAGERHRLAQQARARAAAEYALDVNVDRTEDLYRELAE